MSDRIAQIFTGHKSLLEAIAKVQKHLDEAYLSGEETCNVDEWTMGCAGCQARLVDLLLDMVRRDVEDDEMRIPAEDLK